MKLNRVNIIGFKSFPEHTEISFHEGMTAIVGPNGCGKSNISDAIGWVLGEQSAKSLRGQKMEDLIFNGSESRPPVGLAEVNLHLAQVNGEPSVERREVVVTRRLYRSGDSEYLMDGSPCRLRDIHELFMDTGVGTKAYSIIEQGKIGLILSSKPTDRRGLIEEAAGITKYKARRRSAELKLQAAQQNLLRINDIIYEVDRQMSSLKRQASKARRYRRLREKASHLEKITAVKKSRRLEDELGRLRARLGSVADEELRRSVSLSTAENYLERLRLEQAEAEAALGSARDHLHELEITIERLDNSLDSGRQQLEELGSRYVQLGADLEELEGRQGPARTHLAEREREAVAVRERLAAMEQTGAATQRELSQAHLALAEAERGLEEGRAEVVHRISKIAALRNFLQGVVANSDKVSAELTKLAEEARELATERRRIESERAVVDRELEEKRRTGEALAAERARREASHRELEARRESAERELVARREDISKLSARLASFEELVSSRSLYGEGAKHLLTRGPENGIEIGGAVADAIEVEPRFERAAERFYGTALQRVLVADPERAMAARSFLESQEAGRCDLFVESLAVNGMSDGTRTTLERLRQRLGGVVGLLSDAVRWLNEHSPACRRVLPDAIVVESLDQALDAFRQEPGSCYVTLAGEVVEPPGVIRVGPGGPSEGVLRTRREIREMSSLLDETRLTVGSLETKRAEIEGELLETTERLSALREEQHALEKSLVGLEHRRQQVTEEDSRATRKEQVLASERERSESERSNLGAKRMEMEQSLDAEQRAKDETEARLVTLRESLANRRMKVERLQSEAAEKGSQVAALRERAQAARVDVERLREGVRELESRIEAARGERGELGRRRSRLDEQLRRHREENEQAIAARDAERERFVELDGRASQLRARIETTEAAIKHRRRELAEVRDRRSQSEVELARQDSEMAHLRDGFFRSHGVSLEEGRAVLNPAELERPDDDLADELGECRRKLDAVGPVNPMADEEFRELETRNQFLTTQRQDLLDSISSTETAIRRINSTSRQRFQEAFTEINRHFEVTFKELFGGGRAGLRLIDEDDVLESGIDIIAQPPGKKLQNVLLLSGGEKAMTAIALMFAIFRYKPSPFCLLDEVDAPLDETNVGRFLSMLRALRGTTQFIVITHNRKTMEMADQMYGVTMEEPGISKLVSVRFVEDAPAEVAASTA